MRYRIGLSALIIAFTFAGNLRAQIEVFTDRTLFAAGENILFSAFVRKTGLQAEDSWSKVLYLDLVRPDGTSVSRGKFPVSGITAEGYLPVPDQVLTGNYYLVAYTRWMQNFSPIHYEYKLIKIVNPFIAEMEPSCLQGTGDLPFSRRTQLDYIDEVISCKPLHSHYRWEEQVQLSFQISKQHSPASSLIVLAGRPEVMDSLLYTSVIPDSIYFQSPDTIQYPPDLMGLSLSGKVLSRDTGEPVNNTLVELSMLGQDQQFHVRPTENDGSFVLGLDSITGSREMFISARDMEERDLEIRVDNDYAISNFAFSPRPFTLTETELEEAQRIMINSQLGQRFQESSQGSADLVNPVESSFYGLPSDRILIDDYVQLPTLKEVLIELIPTVLPVLHNKKPALQFSGNIASRDFMSFYEPLLLLDNVPVYKLENLLGMNPQKLHSIEVVNELYILGNTIYGGILSITSKNGDMAGIDLPDNSFFFDFAGFLPQPLLESFTDTNSGEENRIPDLRNTLFWETGLELNPGQTSQVTLTAPGRPGRYLVLIRGLTAEGRILQGRCSFMVE